MLEAGLGGAVGAPALVGLDRGVGGDRHDGGAGRKAIRRLVFFFCCACFVQLRIVRSSAHSAEIGRSRVALAQGRAPDALKILVDVVSPDATEQPDPWLSYWSTIRTPTRCSKPGGRICSDGSPLAPLPDARLGAGCPRRRRCRGCRTAPQQAVFSARVDTVRVDIDVRRDDKPVSGLTAADFEVLDNGVPQKVDLIAPSAAPINVVLALDTSASLNAKERSHLTAAGTKVIEALKASESAAFLTFSERIAIHSLFTVGRSGAEGADRGADRLGRHRALRRRARGHAGRHRRSRAADRDPLQRRRRHGELPRRGRRGRNGAAHGLGGLRGDDRRRRQAPAAARDDHGRRVRQGERRSRRWDRASPRSSRASAGAT